MWRRGIGAVLLLLCFCVASTSTPKKKTFIVHMLRDARPPHFNTHAHWYAATLTSVSASPLILYAYRHVVTGFAASLTDGEARELAERQGVYRVVPDAIRKPLTTRTAEFLGVAAVQDNSDIDASNVVIGVLDTGIWPWGPSFEDRGLPPLFSTKWKGACNTSKDFPATSCNRKLVGAKFFSDGYVARYGNRTLKSKSPLDTEGHGSHTASTAAGSKVADVGLHGYARGTARGMAPAARVAAYKVCWSGYCADSDIIAAMDEAVEDGVDVLSVSIVNRDAVDFRNNSIAMASFVAATEKGLFVSCSAGNDGPGPGTLSNTAPWIVTVAAGSLDRRFPAAVSLENGSSITGSSLSYGDTLLGDASFPLFYAANATNGSRCIDGSLSNVAGKIVICDRGGNRRMEKGGVVKRAGGVGMILANVETDGEELVADDHVLPAAAVTFEDGEIIKKYTVSRGDPRASISPGKTVTGTHPSPAVASFSSRGPSLAADILKPDVMAPGVNILAAWTRATGPSGLPDDHRRSDFNILSGTSMSCPHVSGIAALVKAAHPDWSPAAVKSALITTASTVDQKTGAPISDLSTRRPATAFDMGGGLVNVSRALDPGLVYDIGRGEYLELLCALKYSPKDIRGFTGSGNFRCNARRRYSVADLNYPSFAVTVRRGRSKTATFRRTLSNVGERSRYDVSVKPPPSVKAWVSPARLQFDPANRKREYRLTMSVGPSCSNETAMEFGYVEWKDTDGGRYRVRSPIAVTWK